jgi:hypothetical protein
MVAINFQARFAPLVASGEKRQTIRRNARCKPGDRLQLYTGQRTADCRKLVDPDPVCIRVGYIGINPNGISLHDSSLYPRDLDDFARADGFGNFSQMVDWFVEVYGDPFFTGYVITWEPAPEKEPTL